MTNHNSDEDKTQHIIDAMGICSAYLDCLQVQMDSVVHTIKEVREAMAILISDLERRRGSMQ